MEPADTCRSEGNGRRQEVIEQLHRRDADLPFASSEIVFGPFLCLRSHLPTATLALVETSLGSSHDSWASCGAA